MERIQGAGIQLVGISYDPVSVLAAFSQQRGIRFPLLSDTGSKVIDAYGLRNASARGRQAGIPHPVTIVLDTAGVVRAKLPGTVPQRHTTEALLDAATKGEG